MARRKKRVPVVQTREQSLPEWLWDALGVGAGLMVASLLGCALLGLIGQEYGLTFGALMILLAGTGWAAMRVGAAGVLAGILAMCAGIGAAIEAHHLQLVQQAPQRLSSVPDWVLARDGFVIQTPGVLPLPEYSAHATVTVRQPKHTSHTTREVTPLVERAGGPVVAFTCLQLGAKPQGGTVLVDIATYDRNLSGACEQARTRVLGKLRDRPLAPQAAQRFVLVFDDPAAWAQAPKLRLVLGIAAGMFGFYALVLLLFRKRLYALR